MSAMSWCVVKPGSLEKATDVESLRSRWRNLDSWSFWTCKGVVWPWRVYNLFLFGQGIRKACPWCCFFSKASTLIRFPREDYGKQLGRWGRCCNNPGSVCPCKLEHTRNRLRVHWISCLHRLSQEGKQRVHFLVLQPSHRCCFFEAFLCDLRFALVCLRWETCKEQQRKAFQTKLELKSTSPNRRTTEVVLAGSGGLSWQIWQERNALKKLECSMCKVLISRSLGEQHDKDMRLAPETDVSFLSRDMQPRWDAWRGCTAQHDSQRFWAEYTQEWTSLPWNWVSFQCLESFLQGAGSEEQVWETSNAMCLALLQPLGCWMEPPVPVGRNSSAARSCMMSDN